MKHIALFTAAVASSALFAAPQVSDVTMTQDADRTVTIGYTLTGEPGIVTVDVQTNAGDNVWVSIGGQHLTYFAGDVNKRVGTGARTITWKPRKAWPDNEVTANVKAVVSAWATNAPPDYMVMSLVVPGSVEFYASAEAIPFGVTNDLYKTDYIVMRKIPAANVRWRMGSPAVPEELGRVATREAPHIVTLSDDYYMGIYQVTQRQYERITGERPAKFNLESDYMTRPVENVSFDTFRGSASEGCNWPNDGHNVLATSFVGQLRTLTGLEGIDLPTEAQWEFACRAGCGAALYSGKELEDKDTSANLSLLARYKYNDGYVGGTGNPGTSCTAANGTAKVGTYAPNAWGIYDMLGNVWEFCLDWYSDSPSADEAATGPTSGSARVDRGGAWNAVASACRCAKRDDTSPDYAGISVGFRLSCSAAIP